MEAYNNKRNTGAPRGELASSDPVEISAANKEIAKWEFFLPDKDISNQIWFLSEKIAAHYEGERDEKLFLPDQDAFEDIPDITEEEREEVTNNFSKKAWHEKLFNKISEVLSHNEDPELEMNDDEYSVFFQKHVAEKIYDHFAMLCRIAKAGKRKKEFSLLKELTEELAPDLGLGLYIEKETSQELIEASSQALYSLAENFESWFVGRKKGFFEATFGEVCSLVYFVDNPEEVAGYEGLLVLAADVSQENKVRNNMAKKRRSGQAASA